MSEENDDKNLRDNTSPVYKPANTKDASKAPYGHMGRRTSVSSPNLGSGTKVVDVTFKIQVGEGETEQNPDPELSKEEKRAEYLKSLPKDTVFAPMTGDEGVDKQSGKNGEVLVTKEELQTLRGEQKPQGPQISQSDYAKAFRRASGRTNEIHKDKSNEIE